MSQGKASWRCSTQQLSVEKKRSPLQSALPYKAATLIQGGWKSVTDACERTRNPAVCSSPPGKLNANSKSLDKAVLYHMRKDGAWHGKVEWADLSQTQTDPNQNQNQDRGTLNPKLSVLDLATLESGHSDWLAETPHDPAPSSQLCLPPAPAPAQTPAPAGGVARTLHWDSIGLDEFLAGLTSHHLPPNDPQPRHRPPK
ncbi:hypothetical protein Landi51_13043 [Colletotrichum acutatum]